MPDWRIWSSAVSWFIKSVIRKLFCYRLTLCDSKWWQNVEIQQWSVVFTSSKDLNSARQEKLKVLSSCLCVSCDLFLRTAQLLSPCVPPEKPSWSCTGRGQYLKLRHFNANPLERFRPRIFVFHAWRTPSVLQISAAEIFCLRSIWKNWLVIQFKCTNLLCVCVWSHKLLLVTVTFHLTSHSCWVSHLFIVTRILSSRAFLCFDVEHQHQRLLADSLFAFI